MCCNVSHGVVLEVLVNSEETHSNLTSSGNLSPVFSGAIVAFDWDSDVLRMLGGIDRYKVSFRATMVY